MNQRPELYDFMKFIAGMRLEDEGPLERVTLHIRAFGRFVTFMWTNGDENTAIRLKYKPDAPLVEVFTQMRSGRLCTSNSSLFKLQDHVRESIVKINMKLPTNTINEEMPRE